MQDPGSVPGTPPGSLASAADRIRAAQIRALHKVASGCSLERLAEEVIDLVESFAPGWTAVVHVVDGASPREFRRSHRDGVPHAILEGVPIGPPERERLLERTSPRGGTDSRTVPALSAEGKPLAFLTIVGGKAEGDSAPVEPLLRAAACLLETAVPAIRTVEELKEKEVRHELAARGARDALWHWNLGSGELVVSPRWSSLLGLPNPEEQTVPDFWWSRIHPDDLARVKEELRGVLEGNGTIFESEHRMIHADGRELWVLARGQFQPAAGGAPSRLAGSLSDVTSQKLAEARLRHDASHDDLTGLPNRSLLMEHLRRLLERARRSQKDFRFAVLFLDFDRFKRINDSLGHLAGDQLLLSIGRRLCECVRPGDTVARLGGDEFAIVLEPIGELSEAVRVAERIHQVFREPFHLHGIEIFITTSIGIAVGSSSYDSPADVLRDADTAMYRAKAAGRARHEIFEDSMHARAAEHLRIEAELRRALMQQEFRLLYQPVVSLRDRSITGLEALARWSHPTRGLLAPADFLRAAEETGIIVDLGFWVLREACRQLRIWHGWPGGRELSVHVNLSDRQLFHPELATRVEQALAENGLRACHLVLDIPESVVMQKADSAVAILGQLKSLGVQIHLDDFGTGYSSLGYLHRFEIDTLKIDRSFIRHLRAGGDNWIAVRTILGLAESLSMDVIAEGIETEEQLEQLLRLGCAYGQGSLLHVPVGAEEVARLPLFRRPSSERTRAGDP